ncbi:hypothetical protein [Kineosporia succinea]|uniref:Uncharacterized protein n=1 Tax=Kineosporia succinea TaxID=84632 RepID=A0ABT9P9J3_9ACTN|nr:hypothetical protein [Kineosporia succinea]MDP9829369.1 hypothetical protein [Kineosporia succinea]
MKFTVGQQVQYIWGAWRVTSAAAGQYVIEPEDDTAREEFRKMEPHHRRRKWTPGDVLDRGRLLVSGKSLRASETGTGGRA